VRWFAARAIEKNKTGEPSMRLKDYSIGTRLGAGFATVLLLTLLILGVAYVQLTRLDANQATQEEHAQQLATAEQWRGHTQVNLTRTMALAKSGNQAALKGYLGPQMKETSARISELQKQLDGSPLAPDERSLLTQVGESRKAYVGVRDSLFKAMDAGEESAANKVDSELAPAAQAYFASMTALTERLVQNAKTEAEDAHAAERRTVALMLGVGVLAVLVGGFTAWSLTRSVTRPLLRVIADAERIAEGNLAETVTTDRGDELGAMQRAIDHMRTRLQNLVAGIRQSTDGITTASSEIAAGSQDLSTRTEQTASNLQQAASSMDQLNGTVRMTADSARTANQLAATAAEIASRGGEVVSEVVSNMRDISESSRKIADIIGVIDGIAFQTNILALNAAVEAARAGEQGRGFAVVAGEVRSLAGRSANAAREIKSLIGASVDKVESGVRLVESAGGTMQDIVGSVQRVSDIISEITAATAEQSDGIALVNGAVTQLDEMTQQNAALVEQSAAAAESLKDQASKLADVVRSFRLDAAHDQLSHAAPAPKRPSHRPAPVSTPPRAIAAPPQAPAPARAAPAAATVASADTDWESF
jgi:methyl-accepting chemotaxis protein